MAGQILGLAGENDELPNGFKKWQAKLTGLVL